MDADAEVDETGARFAFGENWREFSEAISDERLAGARIGIERLLGTSSLEGRTFLDVGCGSGLMSVAAHLMGANVVSFDFDPVAVATARSVRDRMIGAEAFPIHQGSVLDPAFLGSLGKFDVVYSWGVLHHTGHLWRACEAVVDAVAPGGDLAIAIYNDQGGASRRWKRIKQAYVEGGVVKKRLLLAACDTYFTGRDLIGGQWRNARNRRRGMDRRHDLVDWVGGFPFEVAKPEEVFEFFQHRGFDLKGLTTCAGGLGCNEFLFQRTATGA